MEIFLIPIWIISVLIVLVSLAKTVQYIINKRIGLQEILSGLTISFIILFLIYLNLDKYPFRSFLLIPFFSILIPFLIYVISNFSNNKLFNFIGNLSLIIIVSSTILSVTFFKYLFEIPDMSS